MKQTLLNEHYTAKKTKQAELEKPTRKRQRIDIALLPSHPTKSIKQSPSLPAEKLEIGDEECQKRRTTNPGFQTRPIRELSQSTTDLLRNLQLKRGQVNVRSVDSILKQPSAKERFGDLLQEKRELLLPVAFKKLHTLFQRQILHSTDQTLNYAKFSHKISAFDSIRAGVEEFTNIKYSLQHFQQILTVFPNAYALQWHKVQKQFQLIMNFPETLEQNDGQVDKAILAERSEYFKQQLIMWTKAEHDAFLRRQGIEYNAIRGNVWHSAFDVNSVQEIPFAQLPEKTRDQKVEEAKAFISELTSVTEKVHSQTQQADQQEQTPSKLRGIKGLTSSVLAKIQARTQAVQDLRKNLVDPTTIARKTREERLTKLATMLQEHFSKYTTPTHFLKKLVGQFYRSKAVHCQKQDIINDITELNQILPDWLRILNTSQGKAIRMDRMFSLTKVTEAIQEKYSQCN